MAHEKSLLRKFLKSNYNIWKWLQTGKKPFVCKQCGSCCSGGASHCVKLTIEEYNRFKDKVELYRSYKNVAIIKFNPCPFLVEDSTCSVYSSRPMGCHIFPLVLDPEKFPLFIDFRVNENCPHIQENEFVDISFSEFKQYLIHYISFILEKNKMSDNSLKFYSEKMVIDCFRRWCPICQVAIKDDEESHEHPLPESIKRTIESIQKKYCDFNLVQDLFDFLRKEK